MKTCLALVVALLLIPSAPAFAQQTAPPGPVEEPSTEPRFNFVPAYAYLHDYGWSEHLFYGWVGTLSMHVSKSLSIVGEFGGSHGTFRDTNFTIQRYALLAGMKLSGGEGRTRPFFQALVGVTRQGGDVGLADGYAAQAGAGADMQINYRWTVRAQADYRFMLEGDNHFSSYRFSGGVVVYLGKRR